MDHNDQSNPPAHEPVRDPARDPNKPYEKHRDGGLEIAVWKRTTDKGTVYNTEMKRSYKDDQGEWQTTRSIPERDLLKAARLQEQAYTSIQMAREYDRVQYMEKQKAKAADHDVAADRDHSQDYGREH